LKRVFGGIETGGTKFMCLVGNSPDQVVDEARFPTTQPDETIQKAIHFFEPYQQRGELTAIGIASFGPLDLHSTSPTYGYITATTKPGWSNVPLLPRIQQALNIPTSFDTDVNAAAFGEFYWVKENRHLDPFVYITVGTGIGVGLVVNQRTLHGLVHTEGGHMFVLHNLQRDPFPGSCPFHGDCLEGLASGPAIAKRWQQAAETLPSDHPAWELEAEYIAQAVVNLTYSLSPQRIVLGGGVVQHPGLIEKIRLRVSQITNGYPSTPWLNKRIAEYIVPPVLGSRSGVLGAIAEAIELNTAQQSELPIQKHQRE
jgi:fructokinase